MSEVKREMYVEVRTIVPVEQAIRNMLTFTRSDYNEVRLIKTDGTRVTTLQMLDEHYMVRTDLGMISMIDGVTPQQIMIYPDTKVPEYPVSWRYVAIQLWFNEHRQWFDEEVHKLKELCKTYPQYKKHFGRYF